MELSSAAAAMAVQRVAARTRASRSSVVLAAICAVIARRANYPELVLPLISSNRFERRMANYVGALSQGAIATVETTGRSFDELVRHTWTTVMEASLHARYDAAKRDAMDELIEHERGLRLNYDPLFNNLIPESWSALTPDAGVQPAEIDHALAKTELRWRPVPTHGSPIRFSLTQIDGCLRLDVWSADTGLLPRAELESVLLAVERLLVAAAHGDVPASRMPALIGLQPIPGTPDRVLIDHCWVDVADVQRLVDDAVAPAVAHVFASAGGRPLVACLTATDAVRTPEQAHARCMAALAAPPHGHHPALLTSSAAPRRPTRPTPPPGPHPWPPAPAATEPTAVAGALPHPGLALFSIGRLTSDEHRNRNRPAPPARAADPHAAGPGRVHRGAGRRGPAHPGPSSTVTRG